jgi:hypothetical protein
MNPTKSIAVFLSLFSFLAVARSVQAQTVGRDVRFAEDANQAALLKQLFRDVRTLKFELYTLQLELQHQKVMRLESELKEVQVARKGLEGEGRAIGQSIAQLDQQLSQSTLGTEERRDLQESTEELRKSQLERLRNQRETLAQQEAEVADRLEVAKRSWGQLSEKSDKLKADADREM